MAALELYTHIRNFLNIAKVPLRRRVRWIPRALKQAKSKYINKDKNSPKSKKYLKIWSIVNLKFLFSLSPSMFFPQAPGWLTLLLPTDSCSAAISHWKLAVTSTHKIVIFLVPFSQINSAFPVLMPGLNFLH